MTDSPVADRGKLPPNDREFESASGNFLLVVKPVNEWKTPLVTATLSKSDGKVLWRKELPHHHGPRQVLVTDDGRVLLVDEWINVLSRYALTLIAANGSELAKHSGDQIISLLSVPRKEISAHARVSAWITEGPTLSKDGKSALFKAGGRSLTLHLKDGQISVEDKSP